MKQQSSNIATVHILCHILITHPHIPQYLLPLASCFMPLLCLCSCLLSLTLASNSMLSCLLPLALVAYLLSPSYCLLFLVSRVLPLVSSLLPLFTSLLSRPCAMPLTYCPCFSLLLLTVYLLSSASELQPLSSISISRVHIISSYVDRDSNICLPTSHHHYFTNCFMVCQ